MAEHIVEIQIVKFETDGQVFANEVGVVVPAVLSGLEDGDTVTFRNKTAKHDAALGQKVSVWFPDKFFADGQNTMELTSDGAQASRVLDVVTAGGPRELRYQVYCHNIRELAVGDSPPKMDIPPPP